MSEEERIDELTQAIAALERSVQSATAAPSSDWWTTDVFVASIGILLFGLAAIGISAWMSRHREPEAVLRIIGTLTIITAGLFLVVAGYSDRQIAPVIGLLGTIAGYILGQGSSRSGERSSTAPPRVGSSGASPEAREQI